MSILIRGMEMPKNCMSCPFPAVGVDAYYCHCPTQDGKEYDFKYADIIPDTCPLIEIPTPHGRLIDADKLMMSLADWWYSSFGEEETDEAKAIRKVLDTVEQSIGEMTVVEAEGSET